MIGTRNYFKNLFLKIEQNRLRVALNFDAFRVEKEEMSLDNKVIKAVSHHLLAATTNVQYKLGAPGLLRQKKDSLLIGFVTHSFNR